MDCCHYHRRRYGVARTLFDFIMILLTGGMWLLWIFIRYLRTNSR